jgi:hypothetical protein
MMPTGCYGVTHKRCRAVVKEELGFMPKGKPGRTPTHGPPGFREGGTPEIEEWLGIREVEHLRQRPGAVVRGDVTLLHYGARS